MKFTPEVIAALQTLKDAAENDFERHRIAVLERNLTEPPKVEVIDDTHQKFDGVVYREDKQGHYRATFHIHRAIYTYYFGEIPEDFVIHHKNYIKSENFIENLQLMSKSDHMSLHAKKELHRSQAVEERICIVCGKPFTCNVYSSRKTCSNDCSKVTRNKTYYEKRICPICGCEFSCLKSRPQLTCSRSCAAKYHWNNHQNLQTCPTCGKIFSSAKSKKQVFCSRSCAVKAQWQNKKSKVQALPAVDINSITTSTDLVATFLDNKTS